MVNAGKLSSSAKARIVAKANRILGKTNAMESAGRAMKRKGK